MGRHELEELQRQLDEKPPVAKTTVPQTAPSEPSEQFHMLTCPNCLQKIKVLHEYLGMRLECTLCSHTFKGTLKSDQKLLLKIQKEELKKFEAEQRSKELHSHLLDQEQHIEDLAAQGVLKDNPTDLAAEPVESYKNVDHSWPYNHHPHPTGKPTTYFRNLWLTTLLVMIALWLASAIVGMFAWSIPDVSAVSVTRAVLMIGLFATNWFVTVLTLLTFCGYVGAIVSHGKGRPHFEGFTYGFCLGPIGWILAGLMPNHAAD